MRSEDEGEGEGEGLSERGYGRALTASDKACRPICSISAAKGSMCWAQ